MTRPRGSGARLLLGAALAGALHAAAPAQAVQTAPPQNPDPPVKTATVRRAASIPACQASTPAAQFCRARPAFNAYDARAKLGSADFTYWVDGENLNIAARSSAEEVRMAGTFPEGLAPLSAGLPYFGETYRLPEVQASIVELSRAGDAAETAPLVWRGPKAPPAPPANAPLKGHVEELDLQSAALGARRKVTVYVPPGAAPKAGWPVILATDGDAIGPYLAILDALIERREARPAAVIAVWSGKDAADRAEGGLRSREYVRRADANAWQRHAMFVRREVLPATEKRFHISQRPSDRLLFGTGEGADWAIETAVRDPAMAASVAAFSPPGVSDPAFRGGKGSALHLYLEAGAYEAPYLKGARTLCNLAIASFVPCDLDIPAAGHTPLAWQAAFAKVVRTVFGAEKPKKR